MEKPVAGEVVVIPFPFSDLSSSKRRPVLVLASLRGNDLILAQITSRIKPDDLAIPIENSDLVDGNLPVSSLVRCGKLFTADSAIIEKTVGRLNPLLFQTVLAKVRSIFS